MNANLAAVLYLVAGVLFILSLRGLSSPASSRQGNWFGMAGMAIAIATTLAAHPPSDGLGWLLVIGGILGATAPEPPVVKIQNALEEAGEGVQGAIEDLGKSLNK